MSALNDELSSALERLRRALKSSSLPVEAKLEEIDGLTHRLRQNKRKRGKRANPEVPMSDLMVAIQYLRQPMDLDGNPEKSVEELVNGAITKEFTGFDRDVDTGIHARRIRRLIERIQKSGWEPLGERIEAEIEAGGFKDWDE